MGVLQGLEPANVFDFFEELEHIPRGSGNTAGVAEYLTDFAEERGLRSVTDEGGNVTIFADGTEGFEQSEPVILQGHMDMVAVKTPESDHDFENDSIDLEVDGEYLTAKDTTLGADDGIAIAMMLAILDDPAIPHPPLECIFTRDEEIGLLGAKEFSPKYIRGRRMINLDSEREGVLTCGCAGGVRVDSVIPITKTRVTGLPVMITISGLLGGHSGEMIGKGRANALKLMGRLLFGLNSITAWSLESVEGGEKDNAIPAIAKARIVIDEEDYAEVVKFLISFQKEARSRYEGTDDGITVSYVKGKKHKVAALGMDSQDQAVFFLMHAPDGVRSMSRKIDGLVEASSNLAIVRTGENEFAASTSIRSSRPVLKKELREELRSLTETLGGSIHESGDYPAWEYRDDSALRETMVRVFEEVYASKPVVHVIHAGLECGIFEEKIPGLDAVSIGPTILDIHTTDEKLSIASAQRTWEYLLRVLAELK